MSKQTDKMPDAPEKIEAVKGRIQDHLKVWPKLHEYDKKKILTKYAEYKIKMMDFDSFLILIIFYLSKIE